MSGEPPRWPLRLPGGREIVFRGIPVGEFLMGSRPLAAKAG